VGAGRNRLTKLVIELSEARVVEILNKNVRGLSSTRKFNFLAHREEIRP